MVSSVESRKSKLYFVSCIVIKLFKWNGFLLQEGVDFGRRLTLCPRKLLPLKDTVILLYPMGKAYPNSAPITGLSDPVGGGANSGDDHDAPHSHWQAAFFKIFPTPRLCMDETLVVPSWGIMVPEYTLSYVPQSRSQTQTCSLPLPKRSQSWNARLHWSVF